MPNDGKRNNLLRNKYFIVYLLHYQKQAKRDFGISVFYEKLGGGVGTDG